MNIQDMLQWWNLIYAIPLVISLVWILASVLSGAHDGGGHGHGAGHDIGHAIHGAAHSVENAAHDLGHAVGNAIHHGHADAGHTHTAQGDHGHSHEGHDHGHNHGSDSNNALGTFLWVIGIGQIPITLFISIFMLCWGAFGIVMNRSMEGTLKYPAVYILPSMGITFAISFVFTRILAAGIARIMPKTETFGVSRFELTGSLGKTVYSISENTGTIDIKDVYGTVHRVQAKIEAGEEIIPSGVEVMVIDFDDEDKRFIVRKSVL